MAAPGGAGAPPNFPPPAPAPGLGGAAGGLAGVGPDVRKEILSKIGDQVSHLLSQAKKDSEAKVKAELKAMFDAMRAMDERLDNFNRQLDEIEESPKQAVEPQAVAQSLAKLEQQWGKELGKLKQELHQTIFAHNHNADLMKHQKDALDQIRTEIEAQKSSASSERIKLAKDKLAKADALLKGQQKQRRLEPLFQRLTALEQRLAAWRWPMGMMGPMGGMPPGMGMPGMGGMPPGLNMAAAAAAAAGRMPNPAAAAAWAGKPGPKAAAARSATEASAAAAVAAAAETSAAAAAGDKDDAADEGGEDASGTAAVEEDADEEA